MDHDIAMSNRPQPINYAMESRSQSSSPMSYINDLERKINRAIDLNLPENIDEIKNELKAIRSWQFNMRDMMVEILKSIDDLKTSPRKG